MSLDFPVRIKFPRKLAATWTSENPILLAGEMGIESDTDQFKLGDGTSTWTALAYGGIEGPAGSGGTITVKDEGTVLTTAATSLNFSGAGVTATNTAGAVTVTVPGGSATTDATLLTSGTLADARLSSNIPKKNTANAFTGNQVVTGNVGAGLGGATRKPLDVSASPGSSAQAVFDGGSLTQLYLGMFSDAAYLLCGAQYDAGWQIDSAGRSVAGMIFSCPAGGSNVDFNTSAGSGALAVKRMQIDKDGNLKLGLAPLTGGGVGVVAIESAGTVPATNPTGGGVLYVEAGALKYRGSGGTLTTLGAA